MQGDGTRPHQIDPRLKSALLHPKRIELLGHLMRKPSGMSERELCHKLGLPFPRVEYHLKVLHDADLIAQVEGQSKQRKAGRSFVAAGGR